MDSVEQKNVDGHQKAGIILGGAFLFGLAWQVRGSGASDPSITLLLLLLYVSLIFGPGTKFHPAVLGVAIILFRVMRRGWGTFVSQAGLPGLFSGYIFVEETGANVSVAWWQGYFWLFMVGIAWGGLVSLIMGGFFLADRKYTWKDSVVFVGIYACSAFVLYFIVQLVIPVLAPEAYYDIYLGMGSTRNYVSMVENLTYALAIVPVLIYIWVKMKDTKFAKRSALMAVFFGLALSAADIWQVLGRNNVLENIPFWSLWEYFSGFLMGLFFLTFYCRVKGPTWDHANAGFIVPAPDTRGKKFGHYVFGHVALFLYGTGESIGGTITLATSRGGAPVEVSGELVFVILILMDLPLYILYSRGTIWKGFAQRSPRDKTWLLLVSMMWFAYVCYFIALLPIFPTYLDLIRHADVWLNSLSVLIVSVYLFKRHQKETKERAS